MAKVRAAYRTFPVESPDLSVAIVGRFGGKTMGRVVDASFGGLAIFFPGRHRLLGRVGREITLRLESRHLEVPLKVAAVLHYVRPIRGGRVCGCGFTGFAKVWARFPPDLRAVFNRRLSRRVEPDEMIQIDVRSGARSFVAIVQDVSPEGIAFATPVAEQTLRRGDRLHVVFRPPGDGEPLRLEAVVCHSEGNSGALECGAAIDWDTTQDAKAVSEKLLKYIDGLLHRTEWDLCLETKVDVVGT